MKLTKLPLLFSWLFQASLTCLLFLSSAKPLCHQDERLALLRLKNNFVIKNYASEDPFAYPKVASWTSDDCCLWDGVDCADNTGHVVSLDLSSSFLYGSINSTNTGLFQLSQLQSLNLADNHFNYSRIPSLFGNLPRLVYLNLSYSCFSGQIPLEIASQLSHLSSLDLSWNAGLELKSPNFSTFLLNLRDIRQLHLTGVDLSSPAPSMLATIYSLTSIDLSSCRLFGEFPNGIFQLPKLKHLSLSYNEGLTGHFPKFQPGSSLEKLVISGTNFRGNMSGLGKLTKLTYLDLSYNSFEGHIPLLQNLSQLTTLLFGGNHLTGPIPSWLANLTQLRYLRLELNRFHGSVPQTFGSLKSLKYLNLYQSQLSGIMNFDMFLSLKHLTVVELSNNELTVLTNISNRNASHTPPKFKYLGLCSCNLRSFPDFLRYQDELVVLDLGDNLIHGQIPVWLVNASTTSMVSMGLADNFLTGFEQSSPISSPFIDVKPTGDVSPFICNMSSLRLLVLSNNKFSGAIPNCFQTLSNSLSVLQLSGNNFHGSIAQLCSPRSSLRMIDLSHNQFQGCLPRSLANCTKLEILNLGNNQFDDVFPSSLATLSKLRLIVLRSNNFNGVITPSPNSSDSEFPSLQIIDLAHNSFSGLLPFNYFQASDAMKSFDASNSDYLIVGFNLKVDKLFWYSYGYGYSMTITNKGIERKYEEIQEVFSGIDLSSNNFEGKIPESFGNLQGLMLLNLSNNALIGNIPTSLGNITHLESFDLSNNRLSGDIPQQLMQLVFLSFFNVSHNSLTGPIPQGNQLHTFQSDSYFGKLGLCGAPLPSKCEGNGGPNSLPPSASKDEQVSDFPFQLGWRIILSGYVSGIVVGVVIERTFNEKGQRMLVKTFGLKRRL